MFLTIVFRFPHLSRAVTTACKALLWAVALLVALALCVAVCVAVCMAVAPHLPKLMIAMMTLMAYALATMPQPRKAAL